MELIINKKNLTIKKNKYNKNNKKYIKYNFTNIVEDIPSEITIEYNYINETNETKNNESEYNDLIIENEKYYQDIEDINKINVNFFYIEVNFILDMSINIDNIEISVNQNIEYVSCKSMIKIILNNNEKILLKIKNIKQNSEILIDKLFYNKIENFKSKNLKKITVNKINDYYEKIEEFKKIYYPEKTNEELLLLFEDNQEIEYYYFTYKYLNNIREFNIPQITQNNYYNAVLFEFKNLPHIEFVIRNMILTLGELWNYTIICGNENYNIIKKICNSISKNIIIIIKTDIIDCFDENYNNLLLNYLFWQNLSGEKILIYNKNSIILNNNINNFIKYDYIGNKHFNLRSKSIMIELLINNKNIEYNERMEKYKKYYNFTQYAEHMYTKKMISNKGNDEEEQLFLSKNKFNISNFAVDKMWIQNNDWKKYMYSNILNIGNYFIDNIDYNNNKKSKYDNLEIIILCDKIYNNFKNIEVINYTDNVEFIENKDYLIINGDYNITFDDIDNLYDHFNNSECNIISPIILKNNMLEYFGAVINNEEIINIDESILKFQYVNLKLPVYAYVQNTMCQYLNLYIIKNINNILKNNKFNKKNFNKKSYEYSQQLSNVKFDPFVLIKQNDISSKKIIKIKNKNNLFPVNFNTEYLKDIYNNYTKFNLLSFKFFDDNYYLTTNKKKTILLIEETIITPDKDCGSLYIYYMLVTFLRMGYNVHFLPCNFYCDEKYTRILQKMGIYVCYTYPYSISYHLKNNYNVYDYIFVCRLSCMEKSFDYIKNYCKRSKIIFITHDINFLRNDRQLEFIKDDKNIKNKIRENNEKKIVELEYIQKADISIVVSKEEYNILNEKEKIINIYYVPICYKLYEDYDRKIENSRDIYFIGSSHPPNIDAVEYFIDNHWLKIIKKMEINFHIIGTGYNNIQQKYIKNKSIVFHGFVPDELLIDMIKNFRINIVPLRFGAGIKGKILQSSNLKIPCISSKIGVEGMEMNNGNDVIVSEFDDNFYIEFEKYYNDIKLLKKISDNSYKIIKKYYSLDKNEQYIRNILYILDNK